MKITLLETSGWYTVFKNLRQSYSLDTRSAGTADTTIDNIECNLLDSNTWNGVLHQLTTLKINSKDLQLLSTLVKKGDSHSKICRGLQTYVEITAPRYWWMEFLTYTIGVLEINPTIDWVSLNSESTMHTIKKGVTHEDFTDTTIWKTSDLINEMVSINEPLDRIKANLPEGYLQTRTFQVSYQAWRRIYQQRYDHKLEEWSKDIVEFIESLPFAKELITIN